MNLLTISPRMLRSVVWFGLWSLATWLILQLHDTPIASDHTICGPWGCGPTIPALVSAHGFWLMVLVPLAVWGARRLRPVQATRIGWIGFGLAIGGMATVALLDWASWPGRTRPEYLIYGPQRLIFAVGTTVEIPLVPGAVAGLILIVGSRRLPSITAEVGCDKGGCDLAHSPGVSKVSVRLGEPLPDLRLITADGSAFVVPRNVEGPPLILYFMRDAGCSICRNHVRSLVDLASRLEADRVEVIIVQPGGLDRSVMLANALSIPFLVSSASGTGAYQAIGLRRGSGMVLIDGRGLVRQFRPARFRFDGFSRSELLESLESLRSKSVGLPLAAAERLTSTTAPV